MKSNSKVKLELSLLDKNLEYISFIALLLFWAVAFSSYFSWFYLIEHISNVFILPSITTILFIGLTILNRYPHIFNYSTKITEENKILHYTRATRIIRFLKTIIVFIFMTFTIMMI
ncbi:MAG: hypothetical protein WCK02_17955 [Bacteroidota bacterium]